MIEDKKWLDGLRDKMDGFEESVPDGLWKDIEASIFPEKKHHRAVIAMPWLWSGVAAAAVAVGAFVGVRFLDSPASPGEGQINVVAAAPDRNLSRAADSDDEGISSVAGRSENLIAEVRPSSRDARRKAQTVHAKLAVHAPDDHQTPSLEESSSVEPECEVIEKASAEPKPDDARVSKEKRETRKNFEDDDWEQLFSETSSRKTSGGSPLTVDLSFSGSTTSSNDVKSFDPMMFYRGSDPAFDHPVSPKEGSFAGNNIQTRSMSPAMFTSSSPITTEAEHRRPVRVALTIHKSFGKVFGVESGLSYSTLRSTFSTISGNALKEEAQTLRYLGVPLNLTASVFNSKRLSVYVIGGGMVEKCVSGKVRTTETVSGVEKGTSSEELTVKPALWSLNAAAGAQANLSANLGLYVEPGLSYHFDDGSSVQTIYKDRPFDFVMTFGARFSFR